jgi:hypothetical protein
MRLGLNTIIFFGTEMDSKITVLFFQELHFFQIEIVLAGLLALMPD